MPEFVHAEVGGINDERDFRKQTGIRGIFVIQAAPGIAISGIYGRLFIDRMVDLNIKFGEILVIASRLITFEIIALEEAVRVSVGVSIIGELRVQLRGITYFKNIKEGIGDIPGIRTVFGVRSVLIDQ
jgi:hypothetical protein